MSKKEQHLVVNILCLICLNKSEEYKSMDYYEWHCMKQSRCITDGCWQPFLHDEYLSIHEDLHQPKPKDWRCFDCHGKLSAYDVYVFDKALLTNSYQRMEDASIDTAL